MQYLDLSSTHVKAWQALLTGDLKAAIPNDADPAADAASAALAEDLRIAAPRRMADLIGQHADLVVGFGRARRIRLLSWMVNRGWPDTQVARDLMDGDSDSDEGSQSSGGAAGGSASGRARIAPIFREDYNALAAVMKSQIVRGARERGTIEALHAGIKEFAQSPDFPTGGMQ